MDTEPSLECGLPDYPCSLAEVALEVLRRSGELADEARARMAAGATTAEAAAWLESQDDVAELQSDRATIRFRVEGGRAYWIGRDEEVFAAPGSAAASLHARGATAGPPPPSGPRPAPDTAGPPGRVIVGPESDTKRALLLSPYWWQFTPFDETTQVALILSGTRGYEEVTARYNADSTAATIRVEDFLGWSAYDVVHLSTHGGTVCDDGPCRARISLGRLPNLVPPGAASEEEAIQSFEALGAEIAVGRVTGRKSVALGAQFFQKHYPSGLENTLVFVNACQTFSSKSSDLVDALGGSSSVVVGWSDAVAAGEAAEAALAFYEDLSEGGYPARVAFDKLGDLRNGTPHPDTELYGPPVLRLRPRSEGGDLRIRDVVWLLRPGSDDVLAGDDVGLEGLMDDGVPDAAPFRVRVDGVLPDSAEDMTVFVSAGDAEAPPVPLSDGTVDELDRWTVSGSVPLGYDVTDDTPLTYRALTTLHSGGDSRHQAEAVLVGGAPPMGYEWRLEATNTAFWTGGIPHTPYGATATMTLEFAKGQDVLEPHPRYEVTGGSVTWDYSHSYYDCVFSAPEVTFPVDSTTLAGPGIEFDTTKDPVTYTGSILTFGPPVTVTSACESGGGSTREHRPNHTWVNTSGSQPGTVSADRTTITGSWEARTDFSTFSFVVRTEYTLTRIR